MEDINLHFVGDISAISSSHNLLAAMLDNHIYQGNSLGIEPNRVVLKRVMDMNDRALRHIVLETDEVRRSSGFDITASSEVMAVMCLAEGLEDMKQRLSKIIVGFSYKWKPVTAGMLKAQGAMTLLLKDAIKPNLVQTIEGVPAFVHGGPFANIAHGCNSLIATKMALKLSEYVVTEAGFGTDLGAEKFFNIKCRVGGLNPNAVVLVVTMRALKKQGGVSKQDWTKENVSAVKAGFPNLEKHIESIRLFGMPLVVAINKRPEDTDVEISTVVGECNSLNVPCAVSQICEKGGQGGIELAKRVVELAGKNSELKLLYKVEEPIKDKLEKIATKIYGAEGVEYISEAERDLREIEKLGLDKLPMCVAKTQFSLSDDSKKLGRPKGFKITVKRLRVSAGAGFIVAYTGDIVTMPGLPKEPAAEKMDITEDGTITGLF